MRRRTSRFTASALPACVACVLAVSAPRYAFGQAASADPCPAIHEVPGQVRTFSCEIARHINTGLARSTTFRALVDRIGALRGIVYVNEGRYWNPDTKRVLNGVLEHRITFAGEYRVLHIRVAPEPGDRPIGTVAHELQHAIEVLESDATSDAQVEALFARIGSQAGAWIFETPAAIEAERAVRKEVASSDSRTRVTADR